MIQLRAILAPTVLAAVASLTCMMASATTNKGQDFPGNTCTCQKCVSGGGDLTGKCESVCKDKTVYSAGSEPHDYCKASAKVSHGTWGGAMASHAAQLPQAGLQSAPAASAAGTTTSAPPAKSGAMKSE